MRQRITDSGIVTSTCALCQVVVGSSSNMDALRIAEIAHNCRNNHSKTSDAFNAPTTAVSDPVP